MKIARIMKCQRRGGGEGSGGMVVVRNQLATFMSFVLERKFLLILMESQVNVLMAVERGMSPLETRTWS